MCFLTTPLTVIGLTLAPPIHHVTYGADHSCVAPTKQIHIVLHCAIFLCRLVSLTVIIEYSSTSYDNDYSRPISVPCGSLAHFRKIVTLSFILPYHRFYAETWLLLLTNRESFLSLSMTVDDLEGIQLSKITLSCLSIG